MRRADVDVSGKITFDDRECLANRPPHAFEHPITLVLEADRLRLGLFTKSVRGWL